MQGAHAGQAAAAAARTAGAEDAPSSQVAVGHGASPPSFIGALLVLLLAVPITAAVIKRLRSWREERRRRREREERRSAARLHEIHGMLAGLQAPDFSPQPTPRG